MNQVINRMNLSDDELYTYLYYKEHDNIRVCFVRCAFSTTLDGFFQEISCSLRFPSYFGWNWDAFDDCMCDLEWLKFTKMLIVVDHFGFVFRDEPLKEKQVKLLSKHLNQISEFWRQHQIEIAIIFNR